MGRWEIIEGDNEGGGNGKEREWGGEGMGRRGYGEKNGVEDAGRGW